VEEPKSVSFEIVSAEGLVEESRDGLKGGTWNDKKVRQTVGVVAQQLDQALKPAFWTDRNAVRSSGGAQTLAHITGAIVSLDSILDGKGAFKKTTLTNDQRAALTHARDRLLLSERILATLAADAYGAQPGMKLIKKMSTTLIQSFISKADAAEQTNPTLAATYYTQAWVAASHL
jgi:hypothetical protein